MIFPATIIGVVFITISLFFVLRQYRADPQPKDFKIIGSTFIVLDNKGRELWRFDTGNNKLASEDLYREHYQRKYYKTQDRLNIPFLPYIVFTDLDSDGQNEVLFCTQTIDEFGEGVLICFNSKGSEIWRVQTGREIQYGNDVYSPDFRIWGIGVEDFEGDGLSEIVVISDHNNDFPTQLLIINCHGTTIGEFSFEQMIRWSA